MKMPRVQCPACGRNVAAMPVGVGQWKAARHDHPGMQRDATGALVSCSASLRPVEPDRLLHQLPLPGSDAAGEPDPEPLPGL
ncbi:hypothetical protein [Streptomyces sp. NPDC101132]|uniref:hypothetical protein n=1 Tax=Streptomyces sp. NPDC101132 TaxID=3366110 RepID=UPI003810E907